MKEPSSNQATADSPESGHLLWSVFSSPAFLCLVVVVALGWILLGTQIPQGMTMAELSQNESFGWVRLVMAFGLHHVFTSWVLGLLVLLTALSLIAMVVRLRTDVSRWRSGSRWPRATMHVDMDDSRDLQAMFEGVSGLGPVRLRGSELRGERGFFLESLFLMGVGVVVIFVTGVMQMNNEVSGRVEISPHDPVELVEGGSEVRIWDEEDWREVNLPLAIACSTASRSDALHTRNCKMKIPRREVEGVIAVGRPLVSSGLAVSYVSTERSSWEKGRVYVADAVTGDLGWFEGDAANRYDVLLERDSGKKVALTLQSARPDGVGWIGLSEEGPLWAFQGMRLKADPNVPVHVGAEGGERVVLAFHETRFRDWFVLGFAVLLVGMLSFVIVPHASFRAVPMKDGGYSLEFVSANRLLIPKQHKKSVEERVALLGERISS